MPDWCKNKLTIRCSDVEIDAIRPSLFGTNPRTGELEVDFNALEECPKSLNIPFTDDASRAQTLLMLPSEKPLCESFIRGHFTDEDANVKHLLIDIEHYDIKTIGEFVQWLTADEDRAFKYCLDFELGRQYIANVAQFGQETYHDWHEKHWGTSRNAETCLIDDSGDELICFFDTAWSEPTAWFELLCQRFPNMELLLEYFSISGFYAGKIHLKDKSYHHYFYDDLEVEDFACDVFDYIDSDEK